MTTTQHLETPAGTLVYDVHGPLPTADGRPPLFCVGAPMDAVGYGTLVTHLSDRTVVTYDPRGLGRSVRTDGSLVNTAEQNAADHHAVIGAIGGGPVEMLASSGGAISALALVTAHPEDVTVLVAHEPPLLSVLPDAEQAQAAWDAVHAVYHERGWGHGMAGFIGLTSWAGPFTAEYDARPLPDPAAFGLPTDDDGTRTDPLLSGVSDAITSYVPDLAALRAAPTRIVVGAGEESAGLLTDRTSRALATLLGTEAVVFPGGHGGFQGDEYGYPGKPAEFAAVLRSVLGG